MSGPAARRVAHVSMFLATLRVASGILLPILLAQRMRRLSRCS